MPRISKLYKMINLTQVNENGVDYNENGLTFKNVRGGNFKLNWNGWNNAIIRSVNNESLNDEFGVGKLTQIKLSDGLLDELSFLQNQPEYADHSIISIRFDDEHGGILIDAIEVCDDVYTLANEKGIYLDVFHPSLLESCVVDLEDGLYDLRDYTWRYEDAENQDVRGMSSCFETIYQDAIAVKNGVISLKSFVEGIAPKETSTYFDPHNHWEGFEVNGNQIKVSFGS